MHGLIKLAAATALSFFGLLIPMVSFSQEIEGPVSVSAGESAHYHFFDDAFYQGPNFNLGSGGSITSQTHSGFNHDADVTWGSTNGVYTLEFRRGTFVLFTLDVTVTCPNVSAPSSASVSPSALCGSGTVAWSATGAGAGETYVWYTASSGGSAITPSTSISATTTYWVGKKNTATGCEGTRISATATVNPLPAAPATAIVTPSTLCGSGTVAWSATGAVAGETYVWYAASSGGSAITPSTSISATTTYWVGKKNTATGCEGTRISATATVNPLPAAPATAIVTPSALCGSGTVAWSATGAGAGETYVWYAASSGGSAITPSTSISATTTYWVGKKVTATGCEGTRTSATATVNPLPAAPATALATPSTLCGSGTVAWSATGAGAGETYVWYTASSGGSAITPSTSISATTTYWVAKKVIASGCESSRISATVTVSPLPTAYNVTGTGAYCSTGSGLTVTLLNSQTGVSYQLKKNGVNEEAAKPGTTGIAVTWPTKPAGTYTVVATNSNGTCLAVTMSGSAVITSSSPPTAYNVTGTGAYCSTGSGLTVTLLNSQTGVSYQLKKNGADEEAAKPGTTGIAVTWPTKPAGTYTVVATNSNGTCLAVTMSGSAVITSSSPPTAYNVTGTGAYCSTGSGLTVTLLNSQTGVSYQLKKNGADEEAAKPGTTGIALTWPTKPVGTYTVVATNSNGTCLAVTMSGSAVITSSSPPTAYNVTGTGAYCSTGSGLTVTLLNSQTGVSYQLKKNGVNEEAAKPGTTGIAVTWPTKPAGTYTVVATNSNGTCLAVTMSGSAVITSSSPPTAYNVTGTGAYCSTGSGLTVTLLNSQTGVSYQLKKNGADEEAAKPGTTGIAVTWPTKPAGTYTVVATNSNGTCLAVTMSGSAVITSSSPPTAYNVTGTGAYCSTGSGLTVTLLNSQTGVSYQLKKNGADEEAAKPGTTGIAVTWPTKPAGTYTVVATNSNGTCLAVTMNGSTAITAVDPAVAGGVVNATVTSACIVANGTATLSGNSGTVVRWERMVSWSGIWSGIWEDLGNAGSTTLSYAVSGIYQYRAIVNNSTCGDIPSIPVTITGYSTGNAMAGSPGSGCTTATGNVTLYRSTGTIDHWESRTSTGGGNWTSWANIAGTGATLPYYNVTVTTQYRAYVYVGGGCSNDGYSTVGQVTISNGIATATVTSACIVANGTATLSGNSGTVVRWERMVSWSGIWSGIWEDLGNAGSTTLSYAVSGIYQYRAIVNNSTCGDIPSIPVTITGYSTGNAMAGSPGSGCTTATGNVTLYRSTGTIDHWESRTSTGGGNWTSWANIAGTGATLPYYNVTVTTQYRAYVYVGGGCSNDGYSTVGQVTISNGIATATVTSACIVANGTATLSGNSGTVVRWERMVSWSGIWSGIWEDLGNAGSTTLSYAVSGIYQYRAIVNNSTCGDIPSIPVTITGYSTGNAMAGSPGSGCTTATGNVTLYRSTGTIDHWESRTSTGGGNWTSWANIAGTGATLPYYNVTVTTQYRAYVYVGGGCSNDGYSTVGQVTISNGIATATVTSACIVANGTATLSGNSGTVVRWERMVSWSGIWSGIWEDLGNAGSTTLSYAVSGIYQYRAIVNNSTCGDIPSIPVTITGYSTGNAMAGSPGSGCTTATGNVTLYRSTGTIDHWESRTSTGGGNWTSWANIAGTGATLPYYNVTVTTQYRAYVYVGGGCSNDGYSTVGQVTISNGIATATVTSACIVANGTATLSGNSGTVVRWERMVSWSGIWSGIWEDLGNAGSTTLSYAVSGIYQYRAIVNNSTCGDIPSIPVTITGYSTGNAMAGSPGSGCTTATGNVTLYRSTGTIDHWESRTSTGGGNWTSWANIAGTGATLPYYNVTVTTQYRAYVYVGGGCSNDGYSTVGQVTIGVGCRKSSDTPLTASWVNDDAQITLTHQPSKGTLLSLERSTDGVTFKDIGAEWTNTDDNAMLAIDHNVRKLKIPILHYRVKFVNQKIDSYSEVVNLERNIIGETVKVFPNPATHLLSINSTDTDDLISVSLMDQLGRPVREHAASREIQFDVSELPSGLYFVMLHYEVEGKKTVKVVIAH